MSIILTLSLSTKEFSKAFREGTEALMLSRLCGETMILQWYRFKTSIFVYPSRIFMAQGTLFTWQRSCNKVKRWS